MNTLLNTIETSIKNAFEEFSKIISEKYKIDSEELENIWNNVSNDMKISIVIKNDNIKTVPKAQVTTKTKVTTSKEDKVDKESTDGCPYIYTRGDNKDTQCGGKTKEGLVYCSRHKKFEDVGQPEKKKMPQAKTMANKAGPKKTSPQSKQIDKTLRMNKEINKFWHPESELIFKSKDERVVIGSYKNNKINKLSDDDIMLCEQYGFKYIKEEEIIDDEDDEDDKKAEEDKKKKIEEDKKKKMEEDKKKKMEEDKKKKIEDSVNKPIKPILEKQKKISMTINDIENVLNELQVDKNEDDYDDDFVEEVEDEDLLDEED